MSFHVNPQEGTTGKCKASKGRCPFGGQDKHFDTVEEARSAAESIMAAAHGGGLSGAKKQAAKPQLGKPSISKGVREAAKAYEIYRPTQAWQPENPETSDRAANMAGSIAPGAPRFDADLVRSEALDTLRSKLRSAGIPEANLPTTALFKGERNAITADTPGWRLKDRMGNSTPYPIYSTTDASGKVREFALGEDGNVTRYRGNLGGRRGGGEQSGGDSGSSFSSTGAAVGYMMSGGTLTGFFAGGILGSR